MPTIKQKKAFNKIIENRGNISRGMIEVGYSKNSAKNPRNLTKSKGWKELIDTLLSDELLANKHKELLEATGIEHMVFPLGVTDKQIVSLLREANCMAKRFMHSDTQTHIWFFMPDNNARKAAIELAYKIKGKIREGNTFINAVQNNTTINLSPEQIEQLNSISAEGEEIKYAAIDENYEVIYKGDAKFGEEENSLKGQEVEVKMGDKTYKAVII